MIKKPIFMLLCGIMAAVLLLSGCQNAALREVSESDWQSTDTVCDSAVPIPPAPDPNQVQVIVLLGQSNAQGISHLSCLRENISPEQYAIFEKGYSEVKIASYRVREETQEALPASYRFYNTAVGFGANGSFFGPELGMAEVLSQTDPQKPYYIIKYTKGGSSLSQDWRSPSSGETTGSLYSGAVEYIKTLCGTLREQGYVPVIRAICWMQGESDAISSVCRQYMELEKNFINDLRADLADMKPETGEIGFVDAGISQYWKKYKIINEAKKALADADPYHDYIDTVGAGLTFRLEPLYEPDPMHYDSLSQLKLGQMFAEVLLLKYIITE